MTTINRQQKSVPTSKNLQKVRHPASVDLRRHFRVPLLICRPENGRILPLVDGRKSSLPADVSHVRKLRTTYASRSFRHSLAFIHRSHNKMPFDFCFFFFFVDLALAFRVLSSLSFSLSSAFSLSFPLSLSFSRSLFQNSARECISYISYNVIFVARKTLERFT